MNRKYLFISFFFTFISFMNFYSNSNRSDIFKAILDKTQGQIVESGFKLSFNTKENGKTLCSEILKTINLSCSKETSNIITDNKNLYTIEFKEDNTNGYIECYNDGNSNVITINFISDCNLQKLNNIKNQIEQDYKNISYGLKSNIYVKAELKSNSIDNAKNETEDILKKEGASNINTVELDNGYSLVANSNRFDPIKNNGNSIDLDCAFCSYSNGNNENTNYIFIGTPVLIASY